MSRGGHVELAAGASAHGVGGSVLVSSGFSETGTSGEVIVRSDRSGDSGTSGAVLVASGQSCAGDSGSLTLISGASTGGAGGDVRVAVGVADPDVSVRRVLLWSLRRGGPAVMEALASADCMRAIFAALNDECPRCRLYAVELVGALSLANPAYAQPALKQHILQLLGDLEHAADGKHREESARLLGALICATPRISVPYAGPVLRCLVSKLNEFLPSQTGAGAGERKAMKGRRRRAGGGGVVASGLCALGDLSRVAGAAVRPRVDDILPLVLEALQDIGAVGRRDAAVVALGMIVESTAYVLAPYFDYPQLLSVLLRALCEPGSLGTKGEVVRAIGVIGALERIHAPAAHTARWRGEAAHSSPPRGDGGAHPRHLAGTRLVWRRWRRKFRG
ncbi:serine/threonine-protein kinase TOR [Pycnococcus provasolii]